jgi:hypothetical protein
MRQLLVPDIKLPLSQFLQMLLMALLCSTQNLLFYRVTGSTPASNFSQAAKTPQTNIRIIQATIANTGGFNDRFHL